MDREANAQQAGSGLMALSVCLAKRQADANVNRNLVFSPLSIYAVLALVAAGARGDTLDGVLRVLGAQSSDKLAEFVARMAETALSDRSESGGPLKPAYREDVVGMYKAEVKAVDFRNRAEEARQLINSWAAQVTRNLIDSILP